MLIICTAKIANATAGHIDSIMAYPVGLQRLGHEVYVMERVGRGRCTDSANQPVAFDQWDGRRHFEAVMKTYGMWPRCCLIYRNGEATHGMPFTDAAKVSKRCDLLMTRSGEIHKAHDIFSNPRSRLYIDGNPGNTQVFLQQHGGEYEALDHYEHLFTLGLNIGTDVCRLPTGIRHWHPLLRPVVLPMWPSSPNPTSTRFTTISSWKGRTTFQWQGIDSGEKSDSWLKFIDLPKRTAQELEVALRIEPRDEVDGEMFRQNSWRLTDPRRFRTLTDYRRYISQSRAEFSVAHHRVVEFSVGWFSDRSALYLASGRPVLVQSTGIEAHLPTGKGLLTFSTIDEALAGIDAINSDYAGHCRAAREIAETYFDSNRVLASVLARVGYA
ncbi:MAG: hypothetical protein AB7P24_04000 [Nitrospira sp.]